jgi:hypothetical protein
VELIDKKWGRKSRDTVPLICNSGAWNSAISSSMDRTIKVIFLVIKTSKIQENLAARDCFQILKLLRNIFFTFLSFPSRKIDFCFKNIMVFLNKLDIKSKMNDGLSTVQTPNSERENWF